MLEKGISIIIFYLISEPIKDTLDVNYKIFSFLKWRKLFLEGVIEEKCNIMPPNIDVFLENKVVIGKHGQIIVSFD